MSWSALFQKRMENNQIVTNHSDVRVLRKTEPQFDVGRGEGFCSLITAAKGN